MEFEVGNIVTGKVTGITKFGAFVSLAPGKSGLVHISEIANSYVNNVSDYLQDGQEVKVKIIAIDENGRINLSIKKALDPQPAQGGGQQRSFQQRPCQPRFHQPRPQQSSSSVPDWSAPGQKDAGINTSFEEKLKQFMQDSDSKISGLYADRRTSRRRGKNG